MTKKSLTDIYSENTKKPEPVPVEQPVEEEGLKLDAIVCCVIADKSYNLNGIKLQRRKGSEVLMVHPDSLDAYVKQNLDKEMTKAYDFTVRFLQEIDVTKEEAMECIQGMRDYYNKYDQQGLTEEQINNLKMLGEKWLTK